MTESYFKDQIRRLRVRFGERAFDNESVVLIWRAVSDMSEAGFERACDVWIGSRPHTKPPLLAEFREARLAEEKRQFESDLRGATNTLKRRAPEEMRKHLRLILSREYGAVDSMADAVEIARTRQRVEKANKGGV